MKTEEVESKQWAENWKFNLEQTRISDGEEVELEAGAGGGDSKVLIYGQLVSVYGI